MNNVFDNSPVNPIGPNMADYASTYRDFRFFVPEFFNFGFDVVDKWALDRTKIAMVWADSTGEDIRKYSFYDLKTMSNRFANLLIAKGVKKGDRIIVMVPRLVEWYAVMLGCFKLGVVPMPAPNILVPHDLEYRINHARAVMAVVWREQVGKFDVLREKCPCMKDYLCVGGSVQGWGDFEALMRDSSPKLDRASVEPTRADDTMLIYFTSGTTKFPKMVPHTQASYGIGHILTAKFWQDLKPTDLHWTLSDTGWAKAAWGKLFGQWQGGAAG
ncbi:acyl-CoA synthetase, partial [bacterium]